MSHAPSGATANATAVIGRNFSPVSVALLRSTRPT
jgi:hypothetical protein